MSDQQTLQCEVNRSAGFDPTGEWAVECGAAGEYCPECEMVVCSYCHQTIAHDRHFAKKLPTGVSLDAGKRKTG